MKKNFKNYFNRLTSGNSVLTLKPIRKIHLYLFLGFIFLNWLILSSVTNLANPDFFRYIDFAQNLFNADFSVDILIPPLHPILMFLIGKVLAFLFKNINTFILSGKIISLVSGLFLIYFTFGFLKKINEKLAHLGLYFIFLSPVFLKFLSWPITDLFFLSLLMISFNYFFENRKRKAVIPLILSVFSRFEGILVLFSYFINFIKLNKKKLLFFSLILIFIICDLFYYLSIISGRILIKLQHILSNDRSYYFFIHPTVLKEILEKNFLFFFPKNFNSTLLTIFFLLFLSLFFLGIKLIYKINKRFFYTVILFIVTYILLKGYIVDSGTGLTHTRRLLPVIFLIHLFTLIGFYSLFKNVKKNIGVRSAEVLFLSSIMILAFIIDYSKINFIFLILLFFLILILAGIVLRGDVLIKKIAFLLTFTLLISGFYSNSFKKSVKFLGASTAKGGYVISNWINSLTLSEGEKVWVFSNKYVINYYCKNQKYLIQNKYPAFIKGSSKDKYLEKFYSKLRDLRVKYIVFDGYIMPGFDMRKISIKRVLMRERKIKKFLKLKRDLMYKGKPAASVLIPMHYD